MPRPFLTPVVDSVPKVADEIAVGEDLNFQRKWWRFERIIWICFLVILICDGLGLFGRGWLAEAERHTADGSLILHYERIERASSPSTMTLYFGPNAVHNGRLQVFISEDVIRRLGAQRISPQPAVSELTRGGIVYSFPVSNAPAIVEIALQPLFPGREHIRIQVPGSDAIEATVFVLP